MPITDRELLIAFKGGDMQAYARIMIRYQVFTNRVAFAFTKDKDKAAELTIKVFMRLWNKRDDIPESASIMAYLCKFTRELSQ